MSELDKAKIDFITDPNELRFHAENPIEEDGRIHVTPELLFAVADKIDGLRAELARRDEIITDLKLKLDVEQGQVKYLDEIISRLKEDAERLYTSLENFAIYDDFVAITLHRALMKELE